VGALGDAFECGFDLLGGAGGGLLGFDGSNGFADGFSLDAQLVDALFGEHGLAPCERVFWAWEGYQHTGYRCELKHTIRPFRREFKPIIARYASKRARNKYCRGMERNLLKAWPALWTFVAHPGVQPTNNHAERALRGPVI
jgi:hypothetical protein